MTSATVAELHIYPVKSLAGGTHGTAQVEPWGLASDRRWMVADRAGRFLTQREHPAMALLHARVQDGVLVLSGPNLEPLAVPPTPGAPCQVRIWRDSLSARDAGDDAAAWLSEALGLACRLVHLADPAARPLNPAYARHTAETVSFADGFPLLLVALGSLADLNRRMVNPLPASRFRPNLVVAGTPAWAEDTWRRLRIGDAVFRVDKPCDRCIMTTIDQQTGLQLDGNEPLQTLGTFRRDTTGRILFGQNLVPERCGTIRAGDAVEILETGPSNAALRAVAPADMAAH